MDLNPYASPSSSEPAASALPPQLTLRRMATLLAIGVSGGSTLGGLTNMINGAVSPSYFRCVVLWLPAENIWLAAVGQGVLEGAVWGLVYAVIFVFLISTFSNRRCAFGVAVRYGLAALGLAAIFWVIGGLCGVAWAMTLPNFRPSGILAQFVPRGSSTSFAWVRGSILAITNGGIVCVLLTNAHYCWKARRRYPHVSD